MRFGVHGAVGLLVLVGAAGCLGPPSTDQLTIVLDDNGECPRRWISHCEAWRQPGQTLVMKDFHLTADAGLGHRVAILVRHLRSDLAFRDFSVRGFTTAIHIVEGGCESCHVGLYDGTIDARSLGLVVEGRLAKLEIQNVSFSVRGPPVPEVRPDVVNVGVGIWWTSNATNVQMESVRFVGVEGATQALQIRSKSLDSTLLVRNASFSDLYDVGTVAVGSTDWTGTTLDRTGQGPELFAPRVRITGFRAANVSLTALHLFSQDAVLSNLRIRDSGVALSHGQTNGPPKYDLSMRDFVFQNNKYGILPDGDSLQRATGKFQDGFVAHHQYSGLQLQWKDLRVENVTFSDNGRGWPDATRPAAQRSPAFYGGLVIKPEAFPREATALVSRSAFVRNVPFAVSSVGGHVVDASENWWNSAGGPIVAPSGADTPPISDRERVGEFVQFWPYRSAP